MASRRDSYRAAGIGAVAGVMMSAWNLVGMYTTIPVSVWDVGRQVVFLATVAIVVAVVARSAGAGRSWAISGALATVTAVACAVTVLGADAISTRLGTDRIHQVPEFILDYTNNGYTSPATYFADHYSELLKLQVFTWVISVVGLVIVGTALGRAAADGWRRATLRKGMRT